MAVVSERLGSTAGNQRRRPDAGTSWFRCAAGGKVDRPTTTVGPNGLAAADDVLQVRDDNTKRRRGVRKRGSHVGKEEMKATANRETHVIPGFRERHGNMP
jgi:hypothetical protein